jgi:DNA-binding CsgD family transcriptional regulator
MLFEPDDRVWHLFSVPDLIAREALHPEPGEASLIRVPVLRWSEVSPVLTELALSDDPFEAVRRQEEIRRADAVRQARHFVEQVLTPAEREVVALVVREGLTDAQIGARTYRSPKTVGHHLSSAYRKARETFGLAEADRHTLTSLLATYFTLDS